MLHFVQKSENSPHLQPPVAILIHYGASSHGDQSCAKVLYSLHQAIGSAQLVLWYQESSYGPQGTGQQAVGHPQHADPYVRGQHGESQEAVTAYGHQDCKEYPGDVAPCLVYHQAQQGGGWGRHQVHQPYHLVSLLAGVVPLLLEEVLGEGHKGEDGPVVSQARQSEPPEGDREGLDISPIPPMGPRPPG